MTRVRIYELAKEAGMSSKALATKLIEQGFDIKGHSSTVDDEMAEKIRSTILQSSKKRELVEKRISATKGPTVIRRRSTIVRKKLQEEPSESDTQEILEQQEEEVPIETAPDTTVEQESLSPDQVATPDVTVETEVEEIHPQPEEPVEAQEEDAPVSPEAEEEEELNNVEESESPEEVEENVETPEVVLKEEVELDVSQVKEESPVEEPVWQGRILIKYFSPK